MIARVWYILIDGEWLLYFAELLGWLVGPWYWNTQLVELQLLVA